MRQIAIINALRAEAPDCRVIVRTTAPPWLFQRSIAGPIELVAAETDTGVVQIDSLRPDERETIRRAHAFYGDIEPRIDREAAWLREREITFVLADAPPLACAAAARAGIPGVVCANFTWDWIYEDYGHEADVADLVSTIGRLYRAASGAWRLPLHGGFATFDEVLDLPFVARHAQVPASDTRERLNLPATQKLVLVSFGGYGLRDFPLHSLDCLDEWGVVVTAAGAPATALPAGVHHVAERPMYERGLRYEDLVRAVDVVITKPGYGIISDCVANRTAMVYTPRGRFAEYDVMVREMPRYLRSQPLSMEAFAAGVWREALRAVERLPAVPDAPATNGAAIAARMILERA